MFTDWWDKSIFKAAITQGLVATGAGAMALSIADKTALDSTFLFSVFGAVTLGDILYSWWFRKKPKTNS